MMLAIDEYRPTSLFCRLRARWRWRKKDCRLASENRKDLQEQQSPSRRVTNATPVVTACRILLYLLSFTLTCTYLLMFWRNLTSIMRQRPKLQNCSISTIVSLRSRCVVNRLRTRSITHFVKVRCTNCSVWVCLRPWNDLRHVTAS